MPPIPRWLAVSWISAGIVGLISALLVGWLGAGFIGSSTEYGLEVLGVTRDLLATAGKTAATIDEITGEAANGLATVEGSVATGAGTLSDVAGLADDLGNVVTSDIPESLDALRATMPQVIATAGVIDGVMRTLRFVGVDYDPDAPLDDSLRAVDAQLAVIPGELRAQAADFEAAAAGISAFAGSSVDIARELGAIRSTLRQSTSILAEYDATVRRGTKVLDDLEAQLEGQIGFARTVTLVLGLALAVGQTVPIAAGWWALRSGPPADP